MQRDPLLVTKLCIAPIRRFGKTTLVTDWLSGLVVS